MSESSWLTTDISKHGRYCSIGSKGQLMKWLIHTDFSETLTCKYNQTPSAGNLQGNTNIYQVKYLNLTLVKLEKMGISYVLLFVLLETSPRAMDLQEDYRMMKSKGVTRVHHRCVDQAWGRISFFVFNRHTVLYTFLWLEFGLHKHFKLLYSFKLRYPLVLLRCATHTHDVQIKESGDISVTWNLHDIDAFLYCSCSN